MNLELITSVVVGLFIYNIIIKAIGAVFIKRILQNKAGEKATEEVRKTFAERLKEKQNEQNTTKN